MGGCVSSTFLNGLNGAPTLVFGAGVTGAPTIEFLKSQGSVVHVVDEKVEAPDVLRSLQGLNLQEMYCAVVSPGWHTDHPLIEEARHNGVQVLSEIDLAWRVKLETAPDQRWLALTGTNGKTTTVQMAEAMLRESGIDATACGNVGFTAIEAVTQTSSEILILELSSFQLEWSNEAHFETVVILNIAEDHIDWHKSFENYAAAKFRITENAKCVILNRHDDEIVRRAQSIGNRTYLVFARHSCSTSDWIG